MPIGLLLKYKFLSKEKIKNIIAPITIFHSPRDEIIPFRHGQTLYKLANEPKEFIVTEGGHNIDIQSFGSAYLNKISEILKPL